MCALRSSIPNMSASADLPDMDGAELLGLLFQDGDGITGPFFPDGKELIEDWLSEQEVSPDNSF